MREQRPPTLRFLGATDTMTGSRYLVRSQGRHVLVDCGLFQGYKRLRDRNRVPFPVNPSNIDAVVLTHAHLDHTGYIPALVRDGFRGPVYATAGTTELCKLLLPDSGYLQEEEARYADHNGSTAHHPPVPLYTAADAVRSLNSFITRDFDAPFPTSRGGPMIIISASGMLTGGRILHHLASYGPDRRNAIILSGYQAGGTRGASLAAGEKYLRIYGQEVRIEAEVIQMEGLSAHADSNEIIQWMKAAPQAPSMTYITHGEPDASDTLRARIKHQLGWKVRVPEHLETVSLENPR